MVGDSIGRREKRKFVCLCVWFITVIEIELVGFTDAKSLEVVIKEEKLLGANFILILIYSSNDTIFYRHDKFFYSLQ
jgi:hypothetical protein